MSIPCTPPLPALLPSGPAPAPPSSGGSGHPLGGRAPPPGGASEHPGVPCAAPGPAEATAAGGSRGARCGVAGRAGRGVSAVLAAGAGRAGRMDRWLGGRRDAQPLLLARCLLSRAGCPSPVAVPQPKGEPYVTVNPHPALSQVSESIVRL